MNGPPPGAVSAHDDSLDDEPPGEFHVVPDGRRDFPSHVRRLGRVLIVDDSVHAREMDALYLNAVRYDALTAVNGEEALLLAIVTTPDVIVMDLATPGISGISAAQQLKLDPRTAGIPVILLTGHPARAIQGRALERGVDVFLTKPCLPDDLEHHVRRLIEKPGRGM